MKLSAIIRLARPSDWTKNLLVFPALLASGKTTEPQAVAAACIAFVAFSLTASGVYSINDVVDWKSDRLHPVKRLRPIASGEMTPREGLLSGVLWIAAGMALALAANTWRLAVVLAGYLVLQVIYSAVLKRISIVDVVALSLGFVLRALAGAEAISVIPSLWLLASVFFLCLYLAQIKRLCDLASMARNNGRSAAGGGQNSRSGGGDLSRTDEGGGWRAAAGYRSVDELSWMLSVSAAASIVTYLMYSLEAHPAPSTGPGVRGLSLLLPFVVIVMVRLYREGLKGQSDSPLHLLTRDPVVLLSACLFGVGVILLLGVESIGHFIDRLFTF